MPQTVVTTIPPITRFFRLLKVDRKQIGNIYLYAVVGGVVALSLPLGIQVIINLIQSGQISTSLTVLVFLVILGMGLAGTLQVLQLVVSEKLQQKIFTRAALEFAFRIPRLKTDTQREHYVPELINRFFDTLMVQKGLSKILLDFSAAGLQVFFGLVLLSLYHPFFILFSLLLVALMFLIFRLTGPIGLATSLKESKYKYEVVHWLEELARSLDTFKLAGNTPLPMERTDKLVGGYLDARDQHFSVLKQQYIYLIGFKVLVAAGLLILGGKLVLDQQMNIGQFVAAEIIIIMVLNSVEKLILSMETIYDVLTSIEKIGNVTDLPLESQAGNRLDTSDATSKGLSITLKNAAAHSLHDNSLFLDNINLSIASGERLCIMGPRNSGKTLLLRLLAGLYQTPKGSISYNGLPASTISLETLRTTLGANLDKNGIFAGSIKENITLGKPDITNETLQEVLQAVSLNEMVEHLPMGYDAKLLPEGRHLSSSAIQKILVARSLAMKPRLLLLENPFDWLAPAETDKLLHYLLDPSQRWTLIVSSRNPELAKRFDRILLLLDGKLQEVTDFASLENETWFHEVFSR
ncbi:peptidase domain-containing ABC transporter [Cesiribacter andamanensis]|uniref:Alpha-hemolysin translocation ATP-binding protein HlyB n=1 Tax=Cesiribacter andamanensis AMV16 TaxID=1279009 RepID=M7NRK9_9BACT|nr:ATP-binding cassette domain-containing protein [Cesiribacter andamanensis]EMR01139.1 Alpha-hemolysin translocation ATP-binding protein HlyB [Cesiribacter andamanensis AMV16]